MKFGQLIEYSKNKIFLPNHGENKVLRLVPELSLVFRKALNEIKASGLNFYFVEKSLRIISPPHFVHDFSIKRFLILYYIN